MSDSSSITVAGVTPADVANHEIAHAGQTMLQTNLILAFYYEKSDGYMKVLDANRNFAEGAAMAQAILISSPNIEDPNPTSPAHDDAISYRDNLLSAVKNLGPVTLQGLFHSEQEKNAAVLDQIFETAYEFAMVPKNEIEAYRKSAFSIGPNIGPLLEAVNSLKSNRPMTFEELGEELHKGVAERMQSEGGEFLLGVRERLHFFTNVLILLAELAEKDPLEFYFTALRFATCAPVFRFFRRGEQILCPFLRSCYHSEYWRRSSAEISPDACRIGTTVMHSIHSMSVTGACQGQCGFPHDNACASRWLVNGLRAIDDLLMSVLDLLKTGTSNCRSCRNLLVEMEDNQFDSDRITNLIVNLRDYGSNPHDMYDLLRPPKHYVSALMGGG